MSKIHIDLETTFETTALLVDEDFREVYLDFEKGQKLFKSIDPKELEFEVISRDLCITGNLNGVCNFQ